MTTDLDLLTTAEVIAVFGGLALFASVYVPWRLWG